MPSLLPGFEYDIFISYRHNDNRSGWVTEFISNLKEELAATIKTPVSVYFDSNPHDGLLESHDVDRSLEGKLRCLIFIPILSQTYCDPKSFAWTNEFMAFIKLAGKDSSGRNVKLHNGNVASRILPIKIHDLDSADKGILEKELGGALRSIDFIYKSAGVNRPLRMNEETPKENLNHTAYRNQINKVANAIKEIIEALKNQGGETDNFTEEEPTTKVVIPPTPVLQRTTMLRYAAVFASIIIAYFTYSFFKKYESTNSVSQQSTFNSVAVLPFLDMSPEKDQKWFSDGLTEELLNGLAQIPDLKVIARTSSFAFEGKNIPIQKIADSLHVQNVVEGSVRKSGNRIKVTAQLIRAADGVHLWSETYERATEDIFLVQEDISGKIAAALNIILDEKERSRMTEIGTKNVNAYEAFLKGRELFRNAHLGDYPLLWKANQYFKTATQYDLNFAMAYRYQEDVFAHYLLGELPRLDTLTDSQAHQNAQALLTKAIELTRNPTEKIFYSIERAYLSDDWSQLPSLTDQLTKDPGTPFFVSSTGFGWVNSVYCILGRGQELYDLTQQALTYDPLFTVLWRKGAEGLLCIGKVSEAKEFLEKGPGGIPKSTQFLFFLYSPLDSAEYLRLLDNPVSFRGKVYRSMSLIKMGKKEEAIKLISGLEKEEPLNPDIILVYDALGDKVKANQIAQIIDSKLLSGLKLGNLYVQAGGRWPFDLNVSPHFKKRLTEAGAKTN